MTVQFGRTVEVSIHLWANGELGAYRRYERHWLCSRAQPVEIGISPPSMISGIISWNRRTGTDFAAGTLDVTTPHFLNYSGNVIVSPAHGSVVPYATAGIGGLSLFEKAEVGVADTSSFLTTNVGGGVKWYAGRWGLRGDYRFIAVQSQDDAPAFFGQETRYGHRIYGGVILNVVR